ncbi:BamA/TamA family outer membrane protein [Flavicella marina]|uniref:BamA/TamA family outer membrane protein n=1 Tax=Flavicella marina TaxID=1475951 RepID=UPI001265A683|nr:BamA/TamA family outer membrane protein [Flavicella marina]
MRKKNIYLLATLLFSFSFIATAQKGKSTKTKEDKNFKTVVIPTISYNNSFKTSFGLMASGFYKLNKKDTISPLSTSMIVGSYSTNNTWFAVQVNKFYFKEDKFRSKVVGGTGGINFQTFLDWGTILDNLPPNFIPPVLPPLPDDGVFVDYNTSVYFIFSDFMVNVYDRLYIGANIVYTQSTTTFDVPTTPVDKQRLFGFGFSSEYDKRDNQMQPITGFNGKLNTTSFLKSLGSTSNYTNITLEYNKYFKQGKRNTLLVRAYGQAAVGDVPFAGQNVVGRDDLRGYSNGKYRANQVYDVQTEYRHWFAEKWGYVAFGGLATAINNPNEISLNNTLPAIGAGVRFMAIPKSRITVGMDVAAGKDDWGIYFRIGEAFTR